MRFRFNFLVRVSACPSVWRATCSAAQMAVEADSEGLALDGATQELKVFVDTEARAQLYERGGNADGLRCPNGTIQLLADRWFCKVTRADCPIGAELSLLDLEESLADCNAPISTKEGIRGAIRAGYPGLHHSAGAYVCPACRDKHGYQMAALRHRWELQTLGEVLDISSADDELQIRTSLIRHYGDPSPLNVGHCAKCLRAVVEKAFPELSGELHIVEVVLDEQWS